MLRVSPTAIEGVLLIEPKVHRDDRGFFVESFNAREFERALGRRIHFVQDNQARSSLGVLRGLHYQVTPHAQGKLVRVAHGAVFDVAVDIRPGSPTHGRWVGLELSADNQRQLWLPPGMAHGYLVTSEQADFVYKTTDYYAPESEGAIRWDDPAIGIEWPLAGRSPVVSAKDAAAPPLAHARPFA